MLNNAGFYRRRQWHPTPVLLPGKSHGWRSLVGCSPWGREESDMTERLPFHFSLSCIGEGNGNPLQCSCLENPRDGGAWWAAIYGVTQSRTRLKRLSSSSSSEGSGGCPISQEGKLTLMLVFGTAVPQDWSEAEATSKPTLSAAPVVPLLTPSPCRKHMEHTLPRSGPEIDGAMDAFRCFLGCYIPRSWF